MVFMLTSKNQKEIPIDVDSIDEDALEWGTSPRHGTPIPLFQHGVHIPHFTTCPDADQHRRRT
jgi:hypothetical protein